MDPYVTPYISIVPRLLPNQNFSKKTLSNDEGYGYQINDNRPISSKNQSLSTRNQLNNYDLNQQDNFMENSFKPRTNKTRLHVEALKDTSGENYSPNSNSIIPYDNTHGNNFDYNSFDQQKDKSSPNNKSNKKLIIIFGMIIGLFSLTALAISIYLLIKMTTTTSG